MKKFLNQGFKSLAVMLLAALSPAVVNAAIIFSDTFEDIGGVSTKLNDAGDPTDLSWYSALSNGTASLVNDTFAGGGSLKALSLSSPDTFRRLGANFPATALGSNTGDKLVLSFVMRLAEAPPGTNNLTGFRFGLYNSNGTPTVSDNANGVNQPPLQADDFGYYGRASVGPVSGSAVDIVEETAGDNPLGGSGGTAIGTGSGLASINDQTLHTFVFELTRSAPSTVDLSVSIDNVLRWTASDSSPVTTTFDAVYFGQGNISTDFVIDNVKLESLAAIPEPGAVFAGVAALAGICFWRRPKARG